MPITKIALIEPTVDSECLTTQIFWQIRCSLPFLSAALKKKGWKTSIFCEELIDLKARLQNIATDFDCAAISLTINTVNRGIEIARTLKKINPKIVIIYGGMVTSHYDNLLLHTGDFLIPGRGEIPFVKLLSFLNVPKGQALSDLSRIKGLIYRDKTKNISIKTPKEENWEDRPCDFSSIVNFGGFSEHKNVLGVKKPPIYSLFFSTGCVNNCKFCMSDKKYRLRKIENVIQDLKEILSRHKTMFNPKIMLVDDCPYGDKKALTSLLEAIAEVRQKNKFALYMQFHVKPLIEGKRLPELMKKAGVEMLLIGFETTNEESLKAQNKNITVADTLRAIDVCRKYNIVPYGYFVAGFDTDTLESIKKTFDFIIEHKLIAQLLPLGVMDSTTLDPFSFGATIFVSHKPAFTTPYALQKELNKGYERIFSLKRIPGMNSFKEALFQSAFCAAYKKWRPRLEKHLNYLKLLNKFNN